MPQVVFDDRLRGSLLGAAIGAELGFLRTARPNVFAVDRPADVLSVDLRPALDAQIDPHRANIWKATAFMDLGIRAYLNKKGRVTPEDFAALLRDDKGISAPVFTWDPVHTTQELLKEGMNPRLSGIGNVPCGWIAASMPAVGIYHSADPHYAYLDGVELASVTQPRLGADWAALCASAVAAAFRPEATAQNVAETVLKIAHENNKDLFYQLDYFARGFQRLSEEDFLNRWYYGGAQSGATRETNYWIANPIGPVLPLLLRYDGDIRKLMAMLIVPSDDTCCVSALIAGAVLGALYGEEAFPSEWRVWAEPIAEAWKPIQDIVKARLEKEQEVIRVVERLTETDSTGASLLFDKVYGCVLAGAIGNAMGSPVEGQYYWEIDQKYPGGVRTILNPAALENEDDNQMAMLLLETYLERSGLPVTARHFGHTWYDRLNRDHYFVNCMGHCYDLIRSGWDPRITGHWTEVTGSTVMCMEPVGVYHIADPEYASIDARAISYMYQRGLDATMAAVLAATVAETLRPDATVESVCEAALSAAPREKLRAFDERAFESVHDYFETCLTVADKYDDVIAVRQELYDKCLLYHPIDPLELLGFALAIFRVAKGDVRQSAIGGTNIGRDSDTISGRAAMLSGALNGSGGVPADWIAEFKPEVLGKIKSNCRRFADLVSRSKTDRLRCRQTLTE